MEEVEQTVCSLILVLQHILNNILILKMNLWTQDYQLLLTNMKMLKKFFGMEI